jgi:hypothetical protein
MAVPLKTMLRLLDVALSQNPDITFWGPVLPISPTTFYISKNHDIPSVSSSPNPPKTIHVVCATSRRPTVHVRLPKPCPHESHVQEVSIFTLYVLLPKDRAKTHDAVCIKFQGNSWWNIVSTRTLNMTWCAKHLILTASCCCSRNPVEPCRWFWEEGREWG